MSNVGRYSMCMYPLSGHSVILTILISSHKIYAYSKYLLRGCTDEV